MCQEFNIESDVIPKIASCFGGGFGGAGDVCGAVVGGVMAIGLVRKQSTTIEEWQESAEVARTLYNRFAEEMGSVKCRDLIGLDLTLDEDKEKLMNSDVAMTVCFPAVAHAFRITMELLEEEKKSQ